MKHPVKTLQALAGLVFLAGWAYLAWRLGHAHGHVRALGHLLAALLATHLVLSAVAIGRDVWTENLTGSPEAPVCPDWASGRQHRIWTVLHLLDRLYEPSPKPAVPAPPHRRTTAARADPARAATRVPRLTHPTSHRWHDQPAGPGSAGARPGLAEAGDLQAPGPPTADPTGPDRIRPGPARAGPDPSRTEGTPIVNTTNEQTVAGLRAWARGSYPLEAAAELLARAFEGRFARPGQSWIIRGGRGERSWLDADRLAEAATSGPYSGGERRLLAVAASLAGGGPVELNEVIPGLDRHVLALVLAAIAHAGGSHEHPLMRPHPKLDGALFPTRDLAGPLFGWPDPDPAGDAEEAGQ